VKLAYQMWMAGDRDEARRAMKQAQIAAEEIGMPEVLASIGYGAATIAREDGDLDAAREHLDRAWSALGDGVAAPQFRAMIASTRGLVAAAEGDLVSARELHVEGLRVGAAANDAPVLALLLVGIADLRLREGDPAEAARLLGAAVAVRGSDDRAVPDVERIKTEARAALGGPGFDEAFASGMTVTMATAAAEARLDPAAEGPDGQRGEDHQQAGRPEQ
jgi:ATP/maltotriose-dependent transcriptional regulator MalT